MNWVHGLPWLPFKAPHSSTLMILVLLSCISSLPLSSFLQALRCQYCPGVDGDGPISLRTPPPQEGQAYTCVKGILQ